MLARIMPHRQLFGSHKDFRVVTVPAQDDRTAHADIHQLGIYGFIGAFSERLQ
jgi:hypothetical protein